MAEPYAPLLFRKKLLGGAEETTAGTAETISAALTGTAIDRSATMTPGTIFDAGKRMPIGNYLGQIQAAPGLYSATLSWEQELRYGDTFPAITTCFGYLNTAGTYKPTSIAASRKTWTFKLYEDGRVKLMSGCVGDAEFTFVNGSRAMMRANVSGIWNTQPTDAALPTQPTVNSLPWVVRAITLTVGGSAIANIARVGIRLGNTVVLRQNVTATSGIHHCYITERAPTVTLDTEARKKADYDLFGPYLLGTEVALNIVLNNGSNTLTITAPKMQRIQVEDTERDGILLDSLTFQLNASSGDDELTFAIA